MVQVPPLTLYARTEQGDIAYQTLGCGPLNLLLVNPMSRSIETMWDYPPNVALLTRLARFSRLIVFDRRGSGISDPMPTSAPPTWEDWLEDILAVLDHMGVPDVAVLAERDSAAAALLFASSYPERVRALVLGNTSSRFRVAPDYPCGESDERSEQLSTMWEQSWGTERMVSYTRPSLVGNAEYVRWVTRMQRTAYSPRRAGELFRYIINFDARAVLKTIQAPTLILHRREFGVIPAAHARYLEQHIPGARLEWLAGSDIDTLMPDDARTPELVEEFLTGAPATVNDERVLTTVLFTDIARSTRVAARQGDTRWRETLGRHHDIVRAELTRFRGREVDSAGDGLFASFDGPARALRCAQAIRTGLREKLDLEIRVGLHTGECERLGAKLSGIAVHIGSRVMHVAKPGEVLASATVKALVAGSGLVFREAGVHELREVPGQWQLYALQSDRAQGTP